MFAFSMVLCRLESLKNSCRGIPPKSFPKSSVMNVPQSCLCTSRVGKQKNVADINKNMDSQKRIRKPPSDWYSGTYGSQAAARYQSLAVDSVSTKPTAKGTVTA